MNIIMKATGYTTAVVLLWGGQVVLAGALIVAVVNATRI